MKKVARFLKVSEQQFGSSNADYNKILLPRRATKGSAGYDFFSPFDFTLGPNETIIIPTGTRVKIEEGYVLMLFPRSSLGFKYKFTLDNTVGIIDSDYYYSDNEGHIMAKLTNHSEKTLEIKQGIAFMQGIFVQFGITADDEATEIRNGGFGSTDTFL